MTLCQQHLYATENRKSSDKRKAYVPGSVFSNESDGKSLIEEHDLQDELQPYHDSGTIVIGRHGDQS
jgi:hypothetical protein